MSKPSKQANSSTPRDAGSPFADSDADVILRSSDLVDFKVHKLIVSKALGAFVDIFDDIADARNDQEMHRDGELPVVRLSEKSSTLDSLLRVVYLADRPGPASLRDLFQTCTALNKYSSKSFPSALRRDLLAHAQRSPCHIYVAACHFRLPDVGKVTARAMVSYAQPFARVSDAFLAKISGLQYEAFGRYRAACLKAARRPCSVLDWAPKGAIPRRPTACHDDGDGDNGSDGGGSYNGGEKGACRCERVRVPPRAKKGRETLQTWLAEYVASVAGALDSDGGLSGGAATKPNRLVWAGRNFQASACAACRRTLPAPLAVFSVLLQEEIERRIDEVEIPESVFA